MKLAKSVGYGIVIYIISFIIGIIAGRALDFKFLSTDIVPDSLWFVSVLVVIVIAIISTTLFFKKNKEKASTKSGFTFGLIVVLTMFAIQFILYLISFIYDLKYYFGLDTYTKEPFLLALITIFIVTTTFTAWIKNKSKERYE